MVCRVIREKRPAAASGAKKGCGVWVRLNRLFTPYSERQFLLRAEAGPPSRSEFFWAPIKALIGHLCGGRHTTFIERCNAT